MCKGPAQHVARCGVCVFARYGVVVTGMAVGATTHGGRHWHNGIRMSSPNGHGITRSWYRHQNSSGIVNGTFNRYLQSPVATTTVNRRQYGRSGRQLAKRKVKVTGQHQFPSPVGQHNVVQSRRGNTNVMNNGRPTTRSTTPSNSNNKVGRTIPAVANWSPCQRGFELRVLPPRGHSA